jgi:hypothetical protein
MSKTTKTYETIGSANPLESQRYAHGVAVDEWGVAHAKTALQGLKTILAVLGQRESDSSLEIEGALTFDATVAGGLISAAAACAALVELVIDGDGHLAQRADFDGPAYGVLRAAQKSIRTLNESEGCGAATAPPNE